MDDSLAEAVDERLAPYGILLLRLSLGAMWLSHAALKIFVFTLPGAEKFFASAGLPGMLVYPVVGAEIIGGVAVLTGFYGRQVSLLLTPILLVAAWVHWPNGWVFTSPNGGREYPVFLAATSLAHGLLGEGAFAIGAGLPSPRKRRN